MPRVILLRKTVWVDFGRVLEIFQKIGFKQNSIVIT